MAHAGEELAFQLVGTFNHAISLLEHVIESSDGFLGPLQRRDTLPSALRARRSRPDPIWRFTGRAP